VCPGVNVPDRWGDGSSVAMVPRGNCLPEQSNGPAYFANR
jgi:hypothetical protein